MGKNYVLSDIVDALGGRIIGDSTTIISRVSSLQNANSGDICFINDAKYLKALSTSKASAFVLRYRINFTTKNYCGKSLCIFC
jgi:UDP-3-O-[3-hydroxymyristoyl] glucosamine N-acyltransferase